MMGCIAELLGLYIVLAAGTKILPESLRFVRYKPWMRTALVIWWLALMLGFTTYARWYLVPKHLVAARSPTFSLSRVIDPLSSPAAMLMAARAAMSASLFDIRF
jgi:hypothetical protein